MDDSEIRVPVKCASCGASFCDCPAERLVPAPAETQQEKQFTIFDVDDCRDWCDQANMKKIDWLITRAEEGIMPLAELEAWYAVYREQVIMELSYTDLLAAKIREKGGKPKMLP